MIDTSKGGRPRASAKATAAWARYRRPDTIRPLAVHIGISQPAVSQWVQVPAKHLDAAAAFLGLTRSALRPDLYPPVDPFAALASSTQKENNL
jgi:hypothetical protein